ncbi:MAG: alanine racemase [Candidatus Eremiobacteraeota bacterium]|nr:alanine racemase [Candidatus Eremiobacteraeota bacterium]
MDRTETLNWVEIDKRSLEHNVRLFRRLVGKERKLMVIVKSNAYGHGMRPVSEIALASGADSLGVFSFEEGKALREWGVKSPVLVMGYIPFSLLLHAAALDLSFAVASRETLEALLPLAGTMKARIHLKLDTGLHRLGFKLSELPLVKSLIGSTPGIEVEGLFTHFANIEDTLHHEFARSQLALFQKMAAPFMNQGKVLRHTACTAATLLFPGTHFEMVRVGIGLYGMWPSKETLITALETEKHVLNLKPVLTWKSRIIQIKKVKPGDTVGYGRSYRVTRPARIAVLPVGYADGYDRKLSSRGSVIIRGKEAPLVGRICMNMCMADITHIPGASVEDEVILLGTRKSASISADAMAELIGTINYEVTTRINPLLPRMII